MKLSERIRKSMDDAVSGLPISWPIDEWADEVAHLEAENATLKRALHELAQFDYRLGIDAMRKFAFDALLADTQEVDDDM